MFSTHVYDLITRFCCRLMKPSDASLYRVKVFFFFRDMAYVYAESLLGFAGLVWNVAMQYVCYAYKLNLIMKYRYFSLPPKIYI